MTIITEKTVFGGNSLAKNNGKTIFVPYSMPGETLEIKIIESKRDYDVAEIVNILEPSPYRITPKCKYYQKCGGCNMMHIDYEYQKQLRIHMLEDIFLQNGIDVKNKVQVIAGPEFNYRARFQLNNGGLCEKASNNIVRIDSCSCAEEVINNYLQEIASGKAPAQKGRVHVFGSKYVEKTGNTNNKIIINETQNAEKVHKSIQSNKNSKKKIKENHYFAGTIASPENTVTVKIGNKQLSFDVRGFFQSNLYVFEKVTKFIVDTLAPGENVLDMYAGCGSISAFLSDKFSNVVLVEHNRDALVFAEQNMSSTKHTSFGLSGANWVKNCAQSCGHFDACVIDPPRSGMEREVCEYLCKSDIPQIRSVSCDPATHARDLSKLLKAGYKLNEIYLLDFYPHTSHIESLAILSKD